MIRSAAAVIVGILVLTVASFAIEAMLRAWAGQSPRSAGAVMTTYTLVCVVAGGYVTASIARRARIGHAAAMGVIQLLFTIGAMVELGETGRIMAWLPTILLVVPAAMAGGFIRRRPEPPSRTPVIES
jgi:hypothetical protein